MTGAARRWKGVMADHSILIIDDNQMNLKLVSVVLQLDGYHVQSAADPEEALEVLGAWRPDLILMDIQLPGMDGLELTRRLKADPATCGIVIIAITAYARKGDEQKALDAGCDGYITKPIDTRSLAGVMDGYLAAGGQQKR